MRGLRSTPVTVITEHIPADSLRSGLVVAQFAWPDVQPREVYTIALGEFVSLELDSHLPVRPNSVSVYDDTDEASIRILNQAFGPEFTDVISNTRSIGFTAIRNFSLTEEQRHFIAGIQAKSPSTPPILRSLVTGMESAHHIGPDFAAFVQPADAETLIGLDGTIAPGLNRAA